jgi:hypothetical protein
MMLLALVLALVAIPVSGASATVGLFAPDCDFTEPPLVVNGIDRYPSGQAQLSATAAGRLVVTNFGRSGRDGWCSALPGWNGEQVSESPPAKLSNNEILTFTWLDATGSVAQLALWQRLGPNMVGVVDYDDDAATSQISWYRNGTFVRAQDAGALAAFTFKDMDLGLWSFHAGTGRLVLQGKDNTGNTWRVVITPASALGRGPLIGSTITLGTNLPGRTILDGLGQELD